MAVPQWPLRCLAAHDTNRWDTARVFVALHRMDEASLSMNDRYWRRKADVPQSAKNYFSVHCHSAASVALGDAVIE
jgi:hypothetical protein